MNCRIKYERWLPNKFSNWKENCLKSRKQKRLVHAVCVKSEEEVAALKEEFDKTSQRYR